MDNYDQWPKRPEAPRDLPRIVWAGHGLRVVEIWDEEDCKTRVEIELAGRLDAMRQVLWGPLSEGIATAPSMTERSIRAALVALLTDLGKFPPD